MGRSMIDGQTPGGSIDPASSCSPAPACSEVADPARVIEWALSSDRKPAQLAFTAGPERQAAYWIEWAWHHIPNKFMAGVAASAVRSKRSLENGSETDYNN